MKGPLLSIQYARAVAALLVVYAHLSGFEAFRGLGLPELGGFGVDLFFVISGFIMWQTAQSYTPGQFALRRVARIVPAYWFYTTLLVATAVFAPALAPRIRFDVWSLTGSYLFIPFMNWQGIANPILLQGWTLNFEMYFYFLFATALLLQTRSARFFFLLSVLALSTLAGIIWTPRGAVLSMITSSMLMEFAFGMALGALHNTWCPKKKTALACSAIGALALIAADIADFGIGVRALEYGVPSTVLLFGLLGLEPWLRRRPSTWLSVIGDSSYSLYLSHPFALSATALAFRRLSSFIPFASTPMASALLFAAVAIAGACALAFISFKVIEKPSARWILGRAAHAATPVTVAPRA